MNKVILYLIFGFSIILQGCDSCNSTKSKADELTLADASIVWWMGPGTVAKEDSIYQKNGLNVKTFDVQTGLASKNAVVSGSADIGLVATTPLALGAFNNENIIVLCSYVESNSLISLLTPGNNDTSFSKPESQIAIVKGTISELYYYNYLKKYYPSENITSLVQLNVKPPDVVTSIESGSAKSAVIWEPFATMLKSKVPTLKINRSDSVYTHRIYVITTPEVLAKKRVAIEKFVKSIGQACEVINSSPKGKEILKTAFPQQELSMNELISKVDFSLKFDYDRMKELIMKDADVTYELEQTPKDKAGKLRKLEEKDIQHYFNHDFKLNQ